MPTENEITSPLIDGYIGSQGIASTRIRNSYGIDTFSSHEEVPIANEEVPQQSEEINQDDIPNIKVIGLDHLISKNQLSRKTIVLNGIYYSRNWKNIIYINDEPFLKTDPKVAKIKGGYCLKVNAVKSWKGHLMNKKRFGVVKCSDGLYTDNPNHTIYFNGMIYHPKNKDIVMIKSKSNGKACYDHSSNVTMINNSTPLSGFYCKLHDVVNCKETRERFFIGDCFNVGYPDGNKYYVNKLSAEKLLCKPIINRAELVDGCLNLFYELSTGVELRNDVKYYKKIGAFMLKRESKKIFGLLLKYNSSKDNYKLTKKFKERITSLNKDISTLDNLKDEIIPHKVNIVRGDINGGSIYFKPDPISSRSIFSQTLNKLGGMNYTFGIEHESCAGVVPLHILEEGGLSAIGDGSTRKGERGGSNNVVHFEYVTSVLHGDKGINKVYDYLPKIGANVLFNDKCSTHIHIGGQNEFNGTKKTDIPSFNRNFSALAILLGAQIEDSLTNIVPKSRDPKNNYYCSSIKEFEGSDISTKEKISNLIAKFVFRVNRLDSSYNSKSSLGQWSKGRYKWLNLINCNTSNSRGFKTIEFRIFPPSTNPNKVHLWVLISMGFVWMVENRPSLIIKGGVTVESMMEEAYKGKEIYSFIKENLHKWN